MSPFTSASTPACAWQSANMRELSLSFVCVEPIPPGVAGACALTFFKGRDELAGCIRVRGEPRAPVSTTGECRPRHSDAAIASELPLYRRNRAIVSTIEDAGIRWGGRAPGKGNGSTISIDARRR